MDISRLILATAAALVLATPAAHAQYQDEASAKKSAQAGGPAKPWKLVHGIGRVLDLSKPPVIIDEPGLYTIQQSWRFSRATTPTAGLIQITADDVTLDLHRFTISVAPDALPPVTLLLIAGNGAEIRNGRLATCCEGMSAVRSTGGGPWLHHLSVATESMTFEGNGARITDASIAARGGIELAGSSTVERNRIYGDFHCVILKGDGNQVTDNRMVPYHDRGVSVEGNGNVVADNVMDATNVAFPSALFDVEGDHNVLRDNTVLVGFGVNILWRISGTANTLDGNIGAPSEAFARIGMQFNADGNYYANNRMAAEVPFALGGTVQTNWGGNVGY